MKVPVVIPARNEAEHIATTLGAMPEAAEPIVIANGCTDDTAAIAEAHGALVLESPVEGKLPALQLAIGHLGGRALEPFMSLDGDSQPRTPDAWLPAMFRARARLDTEQPAVVTGAYRFTHHGQLTTPVRNFMKWWEQRLNHTELALSGTNMLFDLQTEGLVASLMDLPNIWPSEDAAIRGRVRDAGGALANTLDSDAIVLTDADRLLGAFGTLRHSSSASAERLQASYAADAPAGSMTYREYWLRERFGGLVASSLDLL